MNRFELVDSGTPDVKVKGFGELVKRVRQTGLHVQRRFAFPFKKSDIMLFGGVTDRFKWFEPCKRFVAPSPCQLTR